MNVDFTKTVEHVVLLSSLGFSLGEVMSKRGTSDGATDGDETKMVLGQKFVCT